MTDRWHAGLGGALGADGGLVAALAGEDLGFGEAQAGVGVTVADATEPHGPLVYVDEGFERLTGYTASETVGRSRYLLTGTDTDPGSVATLRDAAGEGRTATVQLRAERADGTGFVDEVTAVPVTDGLGTVTRVLDIHRDVTGRERRQRALAESADAVLTADQGGTVRYANPAVESTFGYPPAEVVGEPLSLLFPEHEDSDPAARLLASEGTTVRLTGRHRDGSAVELSVSVGAHERSDERLVTGVLRDITGQRRYETALTELHERAGEVPHDGDRAAVLRTAVEAVDALVGLDGAAFYAFDGRDGLEPIARSPAEDPVDLPPVDRGDGVLWTAFVEGEERFVDSGAPCEELSLDTAVAVPVGTHGVLAAGGSDGTPVTPVRREACRLLARNLSAALDRGDCQRELRERDRRLRRLEERVERLDRLNGLIRRVNRALVRAPGAEIAATVSERFAASEGYAVAWLGESDPDGSVTLQAWAGVDREHVDRLLAADGPLGELVAAAARTGTVQVAGTVLNAPDWAAHRADALDGGYQSVAAVPVPVGDRTERVLVVHGRDGDTFDERERDVIGELGRAVGEALRNAGRAALRTDERTEVELSVTDDRLVTNRLAAALGADAEYVGAIPAEGHTLRAFFRFEGARPDAADRLAGLESVDAVQPLAVEEGDGLYQLVLAVPPLIDSLRRYDARLRALSTADGATRVTAVVAGGADVRGLVEDVASVYDGVELRARREDAEPVDTRETFREELLEQLTERQRDALQTALYGGFYEWPRASTGEELAATRDIAASTFQHHLRAAERKLVSAVLDPSEL